MLVDWAVAHVPLPGEHVSGDRHVVEPFSNGTLVAVVDALGHGEEAAATAAVAAGLLRVHAHEAVTTLFQRCHQGMRSTRGAVMSVASFDTRQTTMSWSGVGNVEGFLVRADLLAYPRREALPIRAGIVGWHLPSMRVDVLKVTPGDTLVFATDGVAGGFLDALRRGTPQQIADEILVRFAKKTDDALVLVASCRGVAQ